MIDFTMCDNELTNTFLIILKYITFHDSEMVKWSNGQIDDVIYLFMSEFKIHGRLSFSLQKLKILIIGKLTAL